MATPCGDRVEVLNSGAIVVRIRQVLQRWLLAMHRAPRVQDEEIRKRLSGPIRKRHKRRHSPTQTVVDFLRWAVQTGATNDLGVFGQTNVWFCRSSLTAPMYASAIAVAIAVRSAAFNMVSAGGLFSSNPSNCLTSVLRMRSILCDRYAAACSLLVGNESYTGLVLRRCFTSQSLAALSAGTRRIICPLTLTSSTRAGETQPGR